MVVWNSMLLKIIIILLGIVSNMFVSYQNCLWFMY